MSIKTEDQKKNETEPVVGGTAPAGPVAQPASPEEPAKEKRIPWPLLAAGVLLVVGLIFGFRYVTWSKTHAATDDAQITEDVVQVSPQVSGTVTDVLVVDNQTVKAGDPLVKLDSATYEVALKQAKAALDAAKAQAQGAQATVGLTTATGNAQISEALAGVAQADSGVVSSQAEFARLNAMVKAAQAQESGTEASISSSEANYRASLAALERANQGLVAAQGQANTAQAAVRSAQAQVAANQATANRANRDATRYQTLFAQGAISASVSDQATASAQIARAQLQAAQDGVAQARANLQSAEANVGSARSQVDAAKAAVSQAEAGIRLAKDQSLSAKDAISQAVAARDGARAAINNAKAKIQQAQGQLSQAKTAPRQVNVSQANSGQAVAKVETAQAEYDNAVLNLQRTKIFAPVAGKISRKTVTIGNLVAPGTPLMSLIPAKQAWVVANFKETQLTGVRVGQDVEVEVDAFPGEVFKGHVESIAGGTGATFALLPPDNATGNFTKVVQRVPVKITLDPGQKDLDRLTIGMSVNATIDTASNPVSK